MFQQKSIANVETVYVCHDNTKIPILLSSSHIIDSVGIMRGVVCVVHDIRVQKEAEQKLQTIINTALSGIALSNLQGNFLYTNTVFPKLFGYTRNEFLNMTHSQLLPPDDNGDYTTRYHKLIQGQIDYFHNIRQYQRQDESTFWGHVSVAVIRNIKDEPESVVTFLTDIDKLKRSEIEINKAHTAIQSSITYARRIQDAVLPSIELLKNTFSDCFVLFKPRDVVSGDFYWTRRIDEYVMFAVADCTGHGVPGAFVSILGISLLNEIVISQDVSSAAQILNNLREKVKRSLQQSRSKTEQKDGMDIALCIINTNTNELQFSGAYNPLYIFRNKECIEYKADRQPIGVFHKERPFSNHTFQLEKNDVLYAFSDGYIDQFGGVNGGKYLTKRFKQLLLSIQDNTMPEQQHILEHTFVTWKGERRQIDDVLVMGVKI
jgi:PAS domain S-box-containing protein